MVLFILLSIYYYFFVPLDDFLFLICQNKSNWRWKTGWNYFLKRQRFKDAGLSCKSGLILGEV